LFESEVRKVLKNKTVLVTGGLGSIGFEITKNVLKYNPYKIIVLDNRETEMFYLKREYKNIDFVLCDIRDKEKLETTLKNVDIVFHAAALKHVTICETEPIEAINTNIIGTQNVISASLKNNIERLIIISTDKAVNPTNVMGATKLLAERLASNIKNTNTKIGVVRFGNVLASRGSVLDIWKKQLKRGQKITITHPDMTRFFMDIIQVMELIFFAMVYCNRGEVFIPKIPSVRIWDLAWAFFKCHNQPWMDHYNVIDKNPGEKIHEELISEDELEYILENENFFVKSTEFSEELKTLGFKPTKIKNYKSNNRDYLLSLDEIKKLLSRYNVKNC